MITTSKSVPIPEGYRLKRLDGHWEEHFRLKKVWPAGPPELGNSLKRQGSCLPMTNTANPSFSKLAEEKERFFNYRDLLNRGEITLCRLAEEEGLLIALDQFHYYAHWITPEARPQRFDTYFFVARHPAGQEAVHDQKETTAGTLDHPKRCAYRK